MDYVIKKRVAIVVPCYSEEKNLEALINRLSAVANSLPEIKLDFIFVNDGSSDRTLDILRTFSEQALNIRVIDLSRNFGKEIALTAGVFESPEADAIICMDADLQHPPELIPELISHWLAGVDIVATIRISSEKQPIIRKVASKLYYWIMQKISTLNMASQTTDFRLFDKKVVAAFKNMKQKERMFRGIMDWLGFSKVYVKFAAGPRIDGVSRYSYLNLFRLAIGSMTTFSLWPLRLAGYLGLLITLSSAVLLLWMLGNYFVFELLVFTPLAIFVVVNTFLMGVVLCSIGLVALYVGGIYTEVLDRPLYVVKERINFN